MSSVETGQMSAVETGRMSAAETGQMSAVETRQMSTSQIRAQAQNHQNGPKWVENGRQVLRIDPQASHDRSQAFGTSPAAKNLGRPRTALDAVSRVPRTASNAVPRVPRTASNADPRVPRTAWGRGPDRGKPRLLMGTKFLVVALGGISHCRCCAVGAGLGLS